MMRFVQARAARHAWSRAASSSAPIDAAAARRIAFEDPAPPCEHDDDARAYLDDCLQRHGVAGVSIAALEPGRVRTMTAGLASRAGRAPMAPSTWLQHASLSKTVGTAFALEVRPSVRARAREYPARRARLPPSTPLLPAPLPSGRHPDPIRRARARARRSLARAASTRRRRP